MHSPVFIASTLPFLYKSRWLTWSFYNAIHCTGDVGPPPGDPPLFTLFCPLSDSDLRHFKFFIAFDDSVLRAVYLLSQRILLRFSI